jgi:predicted flavoprotein YhiN
VSRSIPLSRFSSQDRKQVIQGLLHSPLKVSGVFGYKKAEVTAGGIDLKEISAATLESKRVKGLYFAGEILDVDGRIGGFNFQWAWSTGAIAGKSAVKSLL